MELKVIDAKGQVSGSLLFLMLCLLANTMKLWFTNWLLLTWQMPVLGNRAQKDPCRSKPLLLKNHGTKRVQVVLVPV